MKLLINMINMDMPGVLLLTCLSHKKLESCSIVWSARSRPGAEEGQ